MEKFVPGPANNLNISLGWPLNDQGPLGPGRAPTSTELTRRRRRLVGIYHVILALTLITSSRFKKHGPRGKSAFVYRRQKPRIRQVFPQLWFCFSSSSPLHCSFTSPFLTQPKPDIFPRVPTASLTSSKTNAARLLR